MQSDTFHTRESFVKPLSKQKILQQQQHEEQVSKMEKWKAKNTFTLEKQL